MNFLAHIYLSGENEDIKFGNFIGDFVKGKKFKKYRDDIKKGILLHREIDSYTDKHPIVHKSIVRMRPAYGKYAGVVIDILYDHFLSKNWEKYSSEKLESFVIDFNYTVLERLGKIPRKARAFAFPYLKKKRLLCYIKLSCFEEVLRKMVIYTSMPNNVKAAMKIIDENYDLFEEEFTIFFKDLQKHANDFLNQNMPNSNPEGKGN